jgi:hypothetical protein
MTKEVFLVIFKGASKTAGKLLEKPFSTKGIVAVASVQNTANDLNNGYLRSPKEHHCHSQAYLVNVGGLNYATYKRHADESGVMATFRSDTFIVPDDN